MIATLMAETLVDVPLIPPAQLCPAFYIPASQLRRTHALFLLARSLNYQASGASRATSLGFLSSRNPMKTGARNFLSRVHSANLISATNFGLTQCIFFIIEGVMPSTHCPFCFDGRSTNGQPARSLAWNFLCNVANDFVVNPVPTLPANTRSRSL